MKEIEVGKEFRRRSEERKRSRDKRAFPMKIEHLKSNTKVILREKATVSVLRQQMNFWHVWKMKNEISK